MYITALYLLGRDLKGGWGLDHLIVTIAFSHGKYILEFLVLDLIRKFVFLFTFSVEKS